MRAIARVSRKTKRSRSQLVILARPGWAGVRQHRGARADAKLQCAHAIVERAWKTGKPECATRRSTESTNRRKSAPADISIQIYSKGNLVAEGSGLPATMRRTIEQGASALMWSVRLIGVALAFLAPWIIALAAAIGIVRGIRRSRRHREH